MVRAVKTAAMCAPAPSRAKTQALSDLDLHILSLLSRHRVMTQTQLAAVTPQIPIRTLRYRCSRLARQGLLGRTRPYRERHHLDHLGVDVIARSRPRRAGLVPPLGGAGEQGFAHLRAAGVVQADEEGAGHQAPSGWGSGECSPRTSW